MPRRARVNWNPRRGRWYANIGEPGSDGRSREVYAPASIGKHDEDRAWEWFREAKRQQEAIDAPSDVTVDWVAEHYLAWAERRRDDGKMSPEDYMNKARHLGIVSGSLGSRVAATLRPDDLTDFGESLLDRFSPVYSRHVCRTTAAAMRWAVKEDVLNVNPVQGYRTPTVPRSAVRFAERSEAAAFIWHWKGRKGRDYVRSRHDRLTLLLERALIRTGARPKELCVLRWSDITWKGWKSAAGHACAKGVIPPDRWKAGKKTGKPRTIYFTPALTRALRRVHDRPGRHPEFVFVHGAGRAGVGEDVPWESGSRLAKKVLGIRREMIARQVEIRGRIDRGEPVKPWDRRFAAIEIKDEGDNRLVNYRWRHSSISTLLMLGVDVPTVAELTGTSPDMIYRHYGHLLDSHLQEAAEKLIGRKSR